MLPMQPTVSAPPNRFVIRERLLEILSHWRDFRVTRIVAPGGFGKSTLCAQWVTQLTALPNEQRPVTATLSLNAADGALDVFLDRLADACASTLPEFRDLAALANSGEMTTSRAATALAHITATSSRPLVLILDDLYLVPPGPTLDVLQALVDGNAARIHLALVSRTHSDLDLSHPLLNAQVLSLTIDDLTFDETEFNVFAEQHRLTTLTSDHLSQIHHRSGGWAAGLQLLVQALPASRTRTAETLRAAEEAPDLWKYVERAMFNRASRQVSFMVETALLPWLSAELCAVVTETSADGCARILEEITASNGLVTRRHEHEEVRYYVHPVLREILQRRLTSTRPASALEELQRRGARKLAADGEIDAALALLGVLQPADAAARSRPIDVTFVCDLLETVCRPALLRSEIAAVSRWLSYLSESTIRTRPQLAVDAAWAAYHQLNSQIHVHLLRAQTSLQDHPHPPELDVELATLQTLAALHAGRMRQAHAGLQKALAMPRAVDSIAAGYLTTVRGYLLFGEMRTQQQRMQDLEDGYAIFTRNGYTHGRIEALIAAQWLAACYADVAATCRIAERALELLVDAGIEGGTFGVYSHMYAAQELYFADRIPEARQRLERIVALAENGAHPNVPLYHAQIRLQLCTIAENGDHALDIDPLADLMNYREAMARSPVIITAHTGLMRLLRDVRLGRLDRCAETISLFNRTIENLTEDDSPMLQLIVLLAEVLAGRCDEPAMARITMLRSHTEGHQHHSNSMLARLLQVLLLQQRGSDSDAAIILRELLIEVERTNHLRLILDFVPLLRRMLRSIGTPFAEHLLHRESRTTHEFPFGLSDAERGILRHLSSRQNTTVIAEAMHISVNTVRTHVRNLYRKLHVHSREDALDVARETGLL